MVEHRERRYDQRREVRFPIETEGHFNNYSDNIGRNGLLCYTKKHIDEMTLLDMRFQLPLEDSRMDELAEAGWIECKGVVVRCEPVVRNQGEKRFEVAVYFSDISDDHKSLLDQYVRNGG